LAFLPYAPRYRGSAGLSLEYRTTEARKALGVIPTARWKRVAK
jgi:hypothetical protein